YVPVGHRDPDANAQLPREAVLEKLKPILQEAAPRKVGHNLKYHIELYGRFGVELVGIAHDTMLESYVLDSTASRHDIDSLALKYLGYKTIKYEDVTGKGKAQITFSEAAIDQAGTYAAEEADVTFRLHERLWPRLHENAAL